MRALALSLLLAFAACTNVENMPGHELDVKSEVAMPVNALYIGDSLPPCTEENANMMAYKSDKSLVICSGTEKGWQAVTIR